MSPTEGVIGEAWRQYKAHWQHFLTISFLVYVIVAVVSAVLVAVLTWVGALIAALLSIVAVFYLQAALVKAVDDVRDGRADMSLGDTFEAARPHLTSVLVAGILAVLGIALGLVLLIVPGLYLLTIWALIIPVIVLENKSAGESFTRSRELVRGYGWNVFGVILLAALLLIGFRFVLAIVLSPLADWLQGFISAVVSGTVTAPFYAIVVTLMYFRLREAKEQPVPAPAPAPPPPPATPA